MRMPLGLSNPRGDMLMAPMTIIEGRGTEVDRASQPYLTLQICLVQA